tara:strand:+ start:864 stop:1037 length:174 start_codon:yes stop_codon:yes gene_type:complete
MKINLEHGQRVKLLGHAIFGYFYGYNEEGKARFLDEETNQVTFVDKEDLEETYERSY